MLLAAAEALPRMLRPADLARGDIYPRVKDIRKVSAHVAAAVIRAAHTLEGGCRNEEARALLAQGASDDDLAAWAESRMYSPRYCPLVVAHGGK